METSSTSSSSTSGCSSVSSSITAWLSRGLLDSAPFWPGRRPTSSPGARLRCVRAVTPSAPIPGDVAGRGPAATEFYGDDLVGGGSPWRLLRLAGPARARAGTLAPRRRRRRRRGAPRADPRQPGPAHAHLPGARRPVDDVDVVVPVRDAAEYLAAPAGDLERPRGRRGRRRLGGPGRVAALCAAHGARLVRHDAQPRPGAARNSGMRRRPREFIWFLDADVIIADAASDGAHACAPPRRPAGRRRRPAGRRRRR